MPPARKTPYNTDPATLGGTGGLVLPFSVFDTERILALVRAGKLDGIPTPLKHPTDDLLIATVVDNGMPSWSADQMRYHPGLRLSYYLFWLDVKAAAGGDTEAKGRVDGARSAWAEARRIELISDKPNGSIGLWER